MRALQLRLLPNVLGLLLLLSTRQIGIGLRVLIWLAGVCLLAVSVWFALAEPNAHSLVQTALTHPYALLDAFEGNWRAVGAAFSPLLDVLCIASIIVALVALVCCVFAAHSYMAPSYRASSQTTSAW